MGDHHSTGAVAVRAARCRQCVLLARRLVGYDARHAPHRSRDPVGLGLVAAYGGDRQQSRHAGSGRVTGDVDDQADHRLTVPVQHSDVALQAAHPTGRQERPDVGHRLDPVAQLPGWEGRGERRPGQAVSRCRVRRAIGTVQDELVVTGPVILLEDEPGRVQAPVERVEPGTTHQPGRLGNRRERRVERGERNGEVRVARVSGRELVRRTCQRTGSSSSFTEGRSGPSRGRMTRKKAIGPLCAARPTAAVGQTRATCRRAVRHCSARDARHRSDGEHLYDPPHGRRRRRRRRGPRSGRRRGRRDGSGAAARRAWARDLRGTWSGQVALGGFVRAGYGVGMARGSGLGTDRTTSPSRPTVTGGCPPPKRAPRSATSTSVRAGA